MRIEGIYYELDTFFPGRSHSRMLAVIQITETFSPDSGY
jgi:hypothetical protein